LVDIFGARLSVPVVSGAWTDVGFIAVFLAIAEYELY
jgi:hypothetical protein